MLWVILNQQMPTTEEERLAATAQVTDAMIQSAMQRIQDGGEAEAFDRMFHVCSQAAVNSPHGVAAVLTTLLMQAARERMSAAAMVPEKAEKPSGN